MDSQTRLKIGVATLGLLLLLGGCVQASVHSTVNGNGEITDYQMDINMSRQAYGYFESSVQQEGYNSTRDYFQAQLEGEATSGVEVSQEYHGDTVSTHISIDRIDPDKSPAFNVTIEDGKIIYRDRTFVNQSAQASGGMGSMSGMAVDYYLTMPGEITNSNADVVDGNTAEWHSTGSGALTQTPIQATAKRPLLARVPGGLFGVLGALGLLVVGAVVVGVYRYR